MGLLASELRELGAGSVSEDPGGCRVRGPLSFGYKICLWSRCANRVLLPLQEIIAADVDALHEALVAMSWEDHIDPDKTIAVDFTGRGVGIDHTKYGAQRVKDAVADRLRAQTGRRPSVDARDPDVLINAHARGKSCTVAIDLSGASLHRRGYREAAGPAPLKENLAAAMLRFAGWSEIAAAGGGLVDPCCGSGTLVIEAALMAAGIAPGSFRERFGFERWLGHEPETWNELLADAASKRSTPGKPLVGYDVHPRAIELSQQTAARAGVDQFVHFEQRSVSDARAGSSETGLVIANPPFGERMGDKAQARDLFTDLGRSLREHFDGWQSCILATDDDLLPLLGIVPEQSLPVMSGPLEARVGLGRVRAPVGDIVNRLRKNGKKLAKWRKRESIQAYRLYDADIPEYSAAVDVYKDSAVVAEYAPPDEIDPQKAEARRIEITIAVAEVLGFGLDRVHLKRRKRQRGTEQYERVSEDGAFRTISEGGLEFWVNLTEYLDTGLFPDHRKLRAMLRERARGKTFLNLFAYTGAASVYAAAGGAKTTTIDLSNTYLDWAKQNFELNGLDGPRHRFVRADVMQWLERTPEKERFDMIYVDPPTFSNSKAMQSTLDIRRDHVELLEKVAARLAPGGELFFSTNARKFKLETDNLQRFEIEDLSRATTSPDFERRPLHRSWRLTAKP